MKLADVSIQRPVFATMMITAIVVFGLNALPTIGIDLYPDVEFPVITVVTIYPGADPTAVEEKVSKKIEEAVNTLADIRTLRSFSLENVSQVVIEFQLSVDADIAAQDVRDKLAGIQRDLPEDIESPVVQKFDMGALPIVTYAVSGPADMSTVALTQFAEKTLRDNIQNISGVGQVLLIGDLSREIHLQVDPVALSSAGLTIDDLAQLFSAENIELPGGRFDTGTREVALRVDNQIRTADEIGAIELTRINGAPVLVRDVARVVDAAEEPRSAASVNGKPCVLIQVLKQSGTNVVAMAEKVKTQVERLRATFPPDIKVALTSDNSTYIEEAIRDAFFELIWGALLAVLIIGLFLRNKNMTLISAVAIPTSLIGSFAVQKMFGFTFNILTMLSLSLSVGIVIDDAIVVVENIYRHVEKGEHPRDAAHKATNEIGLAVMATTFTIVAVFIPVAFMEGIIGRFFYQFGVMVSVAVLFSLFVSFTLTPMLASRFVFHSESHGRFYLAVERMLDSLESRYARLISWALAHRLRVLGSAFGLLVLSVFAAGLVPAEFMPIQDQGKFSIMVETPSGSSLDHTKRVCDVIYNEVAKIPGVVAVGTAIGGGAQEKVTNANMLVKLADAGERQYNQLQIMSMVRERLKNFVAAKISVQEAEEMGGSGGRRDLVQYLLRGSDLPALEKAGVQIAEVLRTTPGFVDVDTSVRPAKDELKIRVNRAKASQLGVKPAQVAMAIRNLVSSVKVGEIAQGDDRYDILAWLPQDRRVSGADLDQIKVRSSVTGALVSIADVVDVVPGKGTTEIERQARQRQVSVYANLEGLALADAMKIVESTAAKFVPPGTETGVGGEAEWMAESFAAMMKALLLAIILIYIILASQFESFLHPFTIMFSLPFSVIGAFGALLITGYTLSIMSMIGVIMLMGLVTKNAILLVDRANQNLGAGIERTQALVDAGRVRLRPILMTTFAMIFGMLPVAMALSKGSESRAPMAACVIGGLITSTLLTLIVVPVMYSFLDDLRLRVRARSRTVDRLAHEKEALS